MTQQPLDIAPSQDALDIDAAHKVLRLAIGTPEERAGAHELLYRLMIKPQDNAISRYVFRPVARRLSKLLVHTPITPNMLSLTVGAMIAVACVLTATNDMHLVILGAAIQASSGYIDCCDGEIARLKLMSSRLGAWLDTLVDEFSTLAYMAAIGWHCHLHWGHPGWDMWTLGILVGLATYGWSIYCIYYNIIVGVGSANSQDYVGKFEVVPGAQPNSVKLQPAAASAMRATMKSWLLRSPRRRIAAPTTIAPWCWCATRPISSLLPSVARCSPAWPGAPASCARASSPCT